MNEREGEAKSEKSFPREVHSSQLGESHSIKGMTKSKKGNTEGRGSRRGDSRKRAFLGRKLFLG